MSLVRDEKVQQISIKEEKKIDVSISSPLDQMFEKLLADPQLCKKLNVNPSVGLQPHFEIPVRTIKNKGSFFVSKSYTEAKVQTKSWPKCNRISPDLLLMKIPSENECDEIIQFAKESSFGSISKGKKLGLVVSIVDYFELAGSKGFVSEIAKPSDWESRGVEQVSIPMVDFGAEISIEALLIALDKMRECRQRGELIAVHCKAGRGRSYMLCVLFMALLELEERLTKGDEISDAQLQAAVSRARDDIKAIRTHVGLGAPKETKAIDALKVIRSLCKILQDKTKEAKEEKLAEEKLTANLLSSSQAKKDISQMIYFKELAIYAAKNKEVVFGSWWPSKRSKCIEDFLGVINTAKDDKWFNNFDRFMKPLLDAQPNFKTEEQNEKDRAFRRELVDGFKKELTAYLSKMKNATLRTMTETRIEAMAEAKIAAKAHLKILKDISEKSKKRMVV